MPDACSSANLPSYEDALHKVLSLVTPLDPEPVPISGALGRVLAEPIVADRDQPPFNRSTMDGYAVHSGEVVSDKWYAVITTIPAGSVPDISLDLNRGVSAIATGAAVPDAYDAVVPVEQSQESEGRVRFTAGGVKPGAHIHPRGADASSGQALIKPGTLMGPQHIGIASAAGRVSPVVIRRPCVSVLTTGDEVRPPATPTDALADHQIRNSNGPMLDALLQIIDAERMDHAHIPDDPEATQSALREALEKSDVVLTVGGVSAGRRDYIPSVVGDLGFETIIQGVAIQPGKPVFIARAGDGSNRLVVGLPGNPVSVLATAHLFAWPILRKLAGRGPELPWRRVRLGGAVMPNAKREAFRPAKLIHESANVIPWQGSGDLSHTANADGFVRLPAQAEPLCAGSSVDFLTMIGRME